MKMPFVRHRILGIAGVLWTGIAFCAAPLRADDPYFSTQDALLRQADELEQDSRFEQAIPIYEDLVHSGQGRDPHWTAYVLFRLAGAQYQAGYRNDALESANVAATLDPSEPTYQAFQAEMQGSRWGKRSALYHARRNSGSAKRLIRTNGVLHLLVQGSNTAPWDRGEEQKIQMQVSQADRWLMNHAAQILLSEPPVFEHRYVVMPDEPFWRRIQVPDADSTPAYRKAWEKAILVRFGADSYAALFDEAFQGRKFDNRAIVFHTLGEEAGVTVLLPHRPEPTDVESAFVRCENSEWTDFYGSVSYAHQLLHLYGADDLFNKARDSAVPEQDVMNFGAHGLEDCQLCALTQYAIGWTDQPPHLTHLRLADNTRNPKKRKGVHG